MSMPTLLRAELTEGAIESQHRSATVGFVKVSGIPQLMASGPDAVAGALDEVVSKAQEASEAEAVTFLASDIDEAASRSSSLQACRRAGPMTKAGCSARSAASSMHRCHCPSERV